MERTVDLGPQADDTAELQTGISDIIQELRLLRSVIESDQTELERSRARTKDMLARLAALRHAA